LEIDETVEDSRERDKECTVDVRIYTDGSGLDGMAGVAAVMYWGNKPPKTMYYCLGLLTEHTTFEAEAVGVTLSLHMLGHEKDVQAAHISLDNQVVIQSMSSPKPKSCQYIIKEILRQTERIWR
jgi:ribonuclease HI